MRPIKLTLSGWGPYASCEVIDFESFGREGLFLITGATGGGKTTIFDGITYALYGETSGTTREKDFLRSDFAKPETDTFVELVFTHKGQEYTVVRSPRYSRPKKRGQGEVLTSEAATFYEEGKMPLTVLKDVNQRLNEIMGISYKQFKQIAMIAQGEFLDLLLANSKDRVEIFRNLFGTEEQERFQKKLGEKAREAYGALAENKHKMEETISQIRTERVEVGEELDKEFVNLEMLAELVKQEIVADKENVEALSEALKNNEKKAKMLTEKNQECGALEKRILEQQKKIADCVKEKEESERKKEAAVKTAAAEQEAFEKNRKQLETKQEERKELLEKLTEELKTYVNLEEELTDIQISLVRVQEELKRYRDLEKRKKELEGQRKKLLQAQENYQESEADCDKIKSQYEEKDRIYKAAAIGLAARYLEEGKPCPVCGSTSHPNPAVVSQDVPDEKEVESWKKKWQQAEAEKNKVYQQAAKEKGTLEAMEKEYEAGIDSLQITNAQLESAKKKLVEEEAQQKVQKETLETALQEKKKMQKLKEQKEKEQEQFWEEKEQMRKLHEQKLSEVRKEEEKQKLLAEGKKILLEELEKEWAELEKEKQRFMEKLCKSKEFGEFFESNMEKTACAECFREILMILEKEKKSLLKEKEAKVVKITMNDNALRSISEKQKERKALEGKYSLIKGLEQAAVGKNKERMVFEQYVLSAYFEDIVTAANLRLGKMTGGRYQLSKVERVSDGRTTDSLNLEVLDNFTGKKRPVKTLSGGESFKAALSLALGLSDVVQSYAGGIQIETLFIDEGFGALDEESLEQAMSTLESLTEHNRLIGIISHVTELKERIEKQIIVEKGRNGSHITTF